MKKSDVPALLERLGFPFAYDHFAEGEGPDLLGQRSVVDVADIELDFVVLIGAAHADTSIS